MKNKELLKALKAMPSHGASDTELILQQMRQYWGGLPVPDKSTRALDWRQICAVLVYSEHAQRTLLTLEQHQQWFDLVDMAKTKYSALASGRSKTVSKLYNIMSGMDLE